MCNLSFAWQDRDSWVPKTILQLGHLNTVDFFGILANNEKTSKEREEFYIIKKRNGYLYIFRL